MQEVGVVPGPLGHRGGGRVTFVWTPAEHGRSSLGLWPDGPCGWWLLQAGLACLQVSGGACSGKLLRPVQ